MMPTTNFRLFCEKRIEDFLFRHRQNKKRSISMYYLNENSVHYVRCSAIGLAQKYQL